MTVWTCPRCDRQNADEGREAIYCPCGLDRAGWIVGGSCLEYRYPLGDDEGHRVELKDGRSTVQKRASCGDCEDPECQEGGWDDVLSIEGFRFDLDVTGLRGKP